MSWSVIATIRLATYGTRSRASAANRSLGWVVMKIASATASTARSRPASDSPWIVPAPNSASGPSCADGSHGPWQSAGASVWMTSIDAVIGAKNSSVRASRRPIPADTPRRRPASAIAKSGIGW